MSNSVFFNAVVECLLTIEGFEHMSLIDFSFPFKQRLENECDQFVTENATLLEQAYKRIGYTEANAGYDFWLSRQDEGLGFNSHGLGDVGEKLHEAATKYSKVYVRIDGLDDIDGS